MICKEPEPLTAAGERAAAGWKAEGQLAFYLRRAFEMERDVLVFNGLRLLRGDDAAQIDHLVMHPNGMVIIESKSVVGEITINDHAEWSRRLNGRPSGIPSPILQAQRQGEFLRALLQENAEELMGKMLGRIQRRFGSLRVDVLVAISDSGLIHRPQKLELPEVCKADQIPARVVAIMEHLRRANSLFSLTLKDQVLDLRADERERIAAFLLERHRPAAEMKSAPAAAPPSGVPDASSTVDPAPTCKKCGGSVLRILHGQYGYYFKCGCGGNTAIKVSCACGERMRLQKQGTRFTRHCDKCGTATPFFTNPSES